MGREDIRDRTYRFALSVVQLVRSLPRDTTGYVLGRQLVRSGTSIGANVEEAQGASSKKEFAYKMDIAKREARETAYWLRLIVDAKLAGGQEGETCLHEADELVRILTTISRTTAKALDAQHR